MKTLFRIVALLEGISYLILLIGSYFSRLSQDPNCIELGEKLVGLLGMPHGLLFVAYIVLAFIIKNSERWKGKDFAIILFASVLPFGTFYVERKYLYK
jgi:integral membrane protein